MSKLLISVEQVKRYQYKGYVLRSELPELVRAGLQSTAETIDVEGYFRVLFTDNVPRIEVLDAIAFNGPLSEDLDLSTVDVQHLALAIMSQSDIGDFYADRMEGALERLYNSYKRS